VFCFLTFITSLTTVTPQISAQPPAQAFSLLQVTTRSAATGRRSCTTPPSRHRSLNRRLRSSPGHPYRTSSFRRSNPVHQLAQHLLAEFRPPTSDSDPIMVFYARLSLHEPGWSELFQDALEHHHYALASSGSGAGMSCRPLHVHRVYIFLDDSHVPPLFAAVQLFNSSHRPFRPHRNPKHVLRTYLLPLRHR